ncbi:MAG: long-chain-fatty-acid--CoA ligase [Candidatus Tectomicrobia bacterium]|uniref:Long-chain-fatty-acid--CoA ligase n=1 Tax=Tectimicrobiota bacterium TaxID=2528274 RepID=A0A933GMZ0_UNCTE|nr:long-chain-fatty-acid--CoA ligase [Candidatus Tectomicrobia bacterium]
MDFKDVFYTPLSPLSFLKRSATVFPEKTAVIYNDQRYSYADFSRRVHQLAAHLRAKNLTDGARVAFLAPNVPPLLEAHYGIPLAGAVLVAINVRLTPREIAYILNHSESKALFVDSEFAHLVEPIRNELTTVKDFIMIEDGPFQSKLPGESYEEFLQTGDSEILTDSLEDENAMISINYTSGTTGLPKGVIYTHRNAYLNALAEVMETGLNSSSIYLWTLPMFHCNGWCFTWAVMVMGGTHICLRRVDPAQVYRLIEDEGVTHLCGAPTVHISMAEYMRVNQLKFSKKVRMLVAGAPPSPTIINTMEEKGAEMIHVYGLTETYGPHSICEWKSEWNTLPPEEKSRLKARQGVPNVTALEMRVVDENMTDVPRDGLIQGEVIMRGNNVTAGYFKQKEATEKAFAGGWFHSGDLAVMHPDGYIEIKDRAKDIIISGGENISSVEIENVLYQHPDVLEAAILAIPDEKWGEVPKAFITLKPGATSNEEEIIKFCRERLAHFKCPKAVEFCQIPKTSTGKMMKYVLREKEWAGHDKRVH